MKKILQKISFPEQPGTVPLAVVLVEALDPHMPYVTRMMDTSTGAQFVGHYYEDLERAKKDFRKRAEEVFNTCYRQGLVCGTFEYYASQQGITFP